MSMKFTNSLKSTILDTLPYFVSLVLIFNTPLQVYFLRYIHFLLLGICYLILLYFNFLKNIYINKYLLFFLAVIVLWIPISGFMLPSVLIPLIGATDYIMPLGFWLLYYNCNIKNFSILHYSIFLIILGSLIGLFGIYQRFFDPSLFGIMSELNLRYDLATLNELNYNNTYVFRASSFLASTQAYSLFMGVTTSLLIVLWHRIDCSSFLKIMVFCLHFFSGILSGGKVYIFVVTMTIFFAICFNANIYYNFIKKSTTFFRPIVFFIFIALLIWFNQDNAYLQGLINPLNRIFLFFIDYRQLVLDENLRLSIMSNLFNSDIINLLIGHGLGTSSYSAYNALGTKIHFMRFTTESFMLSWWWEMGVIGFLSFLLFYLNAIIRSIKRKALLSAVLISLFLTMLITPAFYILSIFPIWGLFTYFYYNK